MPKSRSFNEDNAFDLAFSDSDASMPKETVQLSQRTTALLASISGNTGQPAQRKPSSDGKSEAKKPRRRMTSEERRLRDAEKLETKLQKEAEKRTQLERKKADKEAETARKLAAKEEKARQKVRDQAIAAVNQTTTDKKAAVRDMTVDLPSSIAGLPIDTQIRAFLDTLAVPTTTHDNPIPGLVIWRRTLRAIFDPTQRRWEPVAPYVQPENHVVCILAAADFATLVTAPPTTGSGDALDAHVAALKRSHPARQLVYLIHGLDALLRRQRNAQNRAYQAAAVAAVSDPPTRTRKPAPRTTIPPLDDDAAEHALLRLQVEHACLVQEAASPLDAAAFVATFTEQLALKGAHAPATISSAAAFATSSSTSSAAAGPSIADANGPAAGVVPAAPAFCMAVGQVRSGVDRADTYVRMLRENVRVTAPVAAALAEVCPGVPSLVRTLRRGGPGALEDVQVCGSRFLVLLLASSLLFRPPVPGWNLGRLLWAGWGQVSRRLSLVR